MALSLWVAIFVDMINQCSTEHVAPAKAERDRRKDTSTNKAYEDILTEKAEATCIQRKLSKP